MSKFVSEEPEHTCPKCQSHGIDFEDVSCALVCQNCGHYGLLGDYEKFEIDRMHQTEIGEDS